jgi:hypothetical protein
MQSTKQQGTGLVLISVLVVAGAGAVLALQIASRSAGAQREQVTERSLAQAVEALVSYAADRPITEIVGPGYLPCPDLDDDGWAESTCGSLSGDTGREERIGRLPWKTLGLPDLRDGHGERLWYAVSSKQKGLLNCAASRGCVDMSPAAALGAITVRDASGRLVHDGTLGDPLQAQRAGALAVVIAPGPPLERLRGAPAAGAMQQRACGPGECDAAGRCIAQPARLAAHCDPRNYLDASASEDNAEFHDRSDIAGRAGNSDGFMQGPVFAPDGRIVINDRIRAVGYAEVMRRVMGRVAIELAHCLRFYASRPENAGRLPWPEAACAAGPYFGHVPDTPLPTAGSRAPMLERWWRAVPRVPESLAELPASPEACRIALPPGDEGPARHDAPGSPIDEGTTTGLAHASWWTSWKPHVYYALAAGAAPSSAMPGCAGGECMELASAEGGVIAGGKAFAILVRQAPGCAPAPVRCDTAGCTRVIAGMASNEPLDVALASP